jgi:hypothetical protein
MRLMMKGILIALSLEIGAEVLGLNNYVGVNVTRQPIRLAFPVNIYILYTFCKCSVMTTFGSNYFLQGYKVL